MGFLIFAVVAVAIFYFVVRLKLTSWIGQFGESFVSKKLFKLDPAHYRILNDLLLPSSGSLDTTQIDHVVVSNYGIFCIETKAHKGWIFGNANQEYWTQVIYRNKERFYNPLRQNFAHTKAIEGVLESRRLKAPIISLVAFPKADKLKIDGTDAVGCARDIIRKIESYISVIYSDAERDEIFNLLTQANIIDKEARKLHNQEVRHLKR